MCTPGTTEKETQAILGQDVSEKKKIWSMIGSKYEDLYRRPRSGISFEEGAVRHMLDWKCILESFEGPVAYHYYCRLRDLQIDSLSADVITIDDVEFPVWFSTNGKYDHPDKKIGNLTAMLVTTGFPIVPANLAQYIFEFEKNEEVTDLAWLKFASSRGRDNFSFYDIMSKTVILAQRSKIDGIEFLGTKKNGVNYIIGTFWLAVRFPYEQLEYHVTTGSFACLYPSLESSSEEGMYTILPHPFMPYTGICEKEGEGLMLVTEKSSTDECRVKKENTVEVSLSDGRIIEMTERSGDYVAIRERPMKQPTSHVRDKLMVPPTTIALPLHVPKPIRVVHEVPGREERIEETNGEIIHYVHWKDCPGMVVGKTLYYYDQEGSQLLLRRSFKFYHIDNSRFRTTRGLDVKEIPPQEEPLTYYALVAVNEIGHLAMEIRSTGLKEVPHLYGDKNSNVVDVVKSLIERVSPAWKTMKVEGPIKVGTITYFVMKENKPICFVGEVDPYQCHYLTSMLWQHFKELRARMAPWRLDRNSPHVLMHSLTEKPWTQLLIRVASAFALKFNMVKGNMYLGSGEYSYEHIVNKRISDINANGKKKTVKKPEKALAFIWDKEDSVKTNSLHLLGRQLHITFFTIHEFNKQLENVVEALVFQSEEQFRDHYAFVSAFSIMLRRNKNMI
jgi:hypothetical protein